MKVNAPWVIFGRTETGRLAKRVHPEVVVRPPGPPCGLCRASPRGIAYSCAVGRAVMNPHLSWRDALLALAIVFVWGTNFVVIRLGLDALPPLFFATLRFLFVVVPAVFFLRKPD